MRVHPAVQHLNGAVTVTLQASFIGDVTDATDKQRIGAYGDPLVNLGGQFVGPSIPAVGTITVAGLPTLGQTFHIGAQTFTWVASGSATGNVVLGIDGPACLANIVTSVTRDLATVTAVGATSTTITVTANTVGTVGNSYTFTSSSTNVTVDGTGTLGGTQVGRGTVTFQMGAPETYKGITTQMAATPVTFMTQLPLGSAGLTPTQAIVADPVVAAQVWAASMVTRISAVMADLRAKTPSQLVALSDSTV